MAPSPIYLLHRSIAFGNCHGYTPPYRTTHPTVAGRQAPGGSMQINQISELFVMEFAGRSFS